MQEWLPTPLAELGGSAAMTPKTPHLLLCLLLILAFLMSTSAQAQQPNCTTPEFRQFDFWLGEWEMRDRASGTVLGRAKVEKLSNGCMMREEWISSGGASGSNLSSYHAPEKGWQMASAFANAPLLISQGQFSNGQLVFVGQAQQWMVRIVWAATDDPSRVKQTWENSSDGGKTWTMTFDAICVRLKSPPTGLLFPPLTPITNCARSCGV